MPRLSNLDFVKDSLYVAYRASAEPQDVVIDVTTDGRAADFGGVAPLQMLLDAINAGAAGGSVFPPSAGAAQLISGPWMGPDAFGPRYRWTIRLAGVAPLFMRTIVEELRRVGWDRRVTALQIVGSQRPDSSSMTVREHHVRAWLEDDTSYVDTWPALGFNVIDGDHRWAAVRVALANPFVPDVRHALEALCVQFVNTTRNYLSEDGEEIDWNPLRILPSFARSKKELCAIFEGFYYKREPSRAVLLNMLHRFHERVARINEAEVRL